MSVRRPRPATGGVAAAGSARGAAAGSRGGSTPADQRRTRSQVVADSPSLMTIVLVAAIGVLAYTIFLFDFSNRGDWPAYLLVLVAESFIVLQALLSLWTILSSGHDPRDYTFNEAQRRLYGGDAESTRAIGVGRRTEPMQLHGAPIGVDVFVTTYGEALDDIRKTVTAAVAMDGEHTVYVLDDGKSAAVRDLAAELGAEYVAREGNAHAKAGNINHALSVTSGELFVILDADFVARPDFLYETVPFFADAAVAFVQTPQAYGNLKGLISRGAGYMQTVFYKFTQPGKNRFNAAFCVGTNVVFRRTAIAEIGGIWQESKSEDVWTSMKLHERGWRSVYIGLELAVGHTPETIETYTKQQLRWATGGFEILLRANPMGRGRNLTLDQRLQYFGTATFYLVGIAPGLLLLVPPMQIYFGITPISPDVPVLTWVLYYAGFYFMQIAVALFTIGSFRWETLLLASASFPIYVKALVNALLNKDQAWSVTGQKGVRNSPFAFIAPQVLALVFLAATSVVGLWQAYQTRSFNLALFWNMLNTAVLGAFVATAFRESADNRVEAREVARLRRTGREPVGEHDRKVTTPVLPQARTRIRSAVPVAPLRATQPEEASQPATARDKAATPAGARTRVVPGDAAADVAGPEAGARENRAATRVVPVPVSRDGHAGPPSGPIAGRRPGPSTGPRAGLPDGRRPGPATGLPGGRRSGPATGPRSSAVAARGASPEGGSAGPAGASPEWGSAVPAGSHPGPATGPRTARGSRGGADGGRGAGPHSGPQDTGAAPPHAGYGNGSRNGDGVHSGPQNGRGRGSHPGLRDDPRPAQRNARTDDSPVPRSGASAGRRPAADPGRPPSRVPRPREDTPSGGSRQTTGPARERARRRPRGSGVHTGQEGLDGPGAAASHRRGSPDTSGSGAPERPADSRIARADAIVGGLVPQPRENGSDPLPVVHRPARHDRSHR
ncbi:glycosyltransferase [Pseudonocardia nematodicida]|uniref:Glycosyltransferase n=1 Tax=Pseudonocardia nematodicida TaxID=1206997 RepID=A0ABV1KI46_9PSEU